MDDLIELPAQHLTLTGLVPKPDTLFKLGFEIQGQQYLTGRRGRPRGVEPLYPPHFYLTIVILRGDRVVEVEFDELVQFQFFPLFELFFGATLVEGGESVLFQFVLKSPAGCDLAADLSWETAEHFFDIKQV